MIVVKADARTSVLAFTSEVGGRSSILDQVHLISLATSSLNGVQHLILFRKTH